MSDVQQNDFRAKMRSLTADERKQFESDMEAHAEKLMRAARPDPPAPDGFAHWPTAPHGAADVFTPHFVPVLNEGDEGKNDEPTQETFIVGPDGRPQRSN